MGAKLTICNNAIARIRAGRISSIEEDSLEARECRHFYPQVIKNMLEGPHPFGAWTRRVVLASATNDREAEWLYAYNVPSDMAAPIALIPDFEASGVSVPFALPGEPYAEAWTVFPQATAPYVIENGILYSNAGAGAVLAYVLNDIEEASISQKVIKALSLDLAAEIAIPVKGMSEADRRAIMQEAELAWQRAIAEDKNRQPEEYPPYVSEREAAREGYY